MKQLYEALAKFQASVPNVERRREGQTGNSSFKYADLADIFNSIRDSLRECGLSVLQPISTVDGIDYINTMVCHISGEMIESSIRISYEPKSVKEYGAYVTYYRRYALSSMLSIVVDDDLDEASQDNSSEKIYLSHDQLGEIEDLINGYDDIRDRMKKKYKNIANIRSSDFEMVVSTIKKLIADKGVK